MMLHHILQAHGGILPSDVLVTFQNTGKEAPETLNFIRDCADHWDVDIYWLERDGSKEHGHRFREVTYATASRHGEPFDEVVKDYGLLPNPISRFCTGVLKIRVMRDFAYSLGWKPDRGAGPGWANIVGLRYDEPHRVTRMRGRKKGDPFESETPLYNARVTKEDVAKFWKSQNFDLGLSNVNGVTPSGNCDLCFLKSAGTLSAIMRMNPGVSDWWIEKESSITEGPENGRKFRIDRPDYAALQKAVDDQDEFDFGDADSLGDCFCTD